MVAAAMEGMLVEKVQVQGVKAVCRGVRKEIGNLELGAAPPEGEFTEQISTLPHPYGRYHRYFHDELMKNRPADSRWAGEDYEI